MRGAPGAGPLAHAARRPTAAQSGRDLCGLAGRGAGAERGALPRRAATRRRARPRRRESRGPRTAAPRGTGPNPAVAGPAAAAPPPQAPRPARPHRARPRHPRVSRIEAEANDPDVPGSAPPPLSQVRSFPPSSLFFSPPSPPPSVRSSLTRCVPHYDPSEPLRRRGAAQPSPRTARRSSRVAVSRTCGRPQRRLSGERHRDPGRALSNPLTSSCPSGPTFPYRKME